MSAEYRVGQRVFADLRNGRPRVVGVIEQVRPDTTYPYRVRHETTGQLEFVLAKEIVSDLPLSMAPDDLDTWLGD